MDERRPRSEVTIEARQRAQREACPPPLLPALERLQRTQIATLAVFREASGLLMQRRRLRSELEREPDEVRQEAIRKGIAALDHELTTADEDRRRASEEVAAVAQEFERAKRAHRIAPVPESRRDEALALLEEEYQTLLHMARDRRAEGERHRETILAAPTIEARLLFARRDGDEAEIARLTALSEAASDAGARLDAGRLAFRERVAEVQAETECRLKALADAED